MKRVKQVRLAVLASAALIGGSTALATPALAAPPDEREVYEMLQQSAAMRKDGMVSKQEFMRLMEKRFDTMDKDKKGMISAADVAKILDPQFAVP